MVSNLVNTGKDLFTVIEEIKCNSPLYSDSNLSGNQQFKDKNLPQNLNANFETGNGIEISQPFEIVYEKFEFGNRYVGQKAFRIEASISTLGC